MADITRPPAEDAPDVGAESPPAGRHDDAAPGSRESSDLEAKAKPGPLDLQGIVTAGKRPEDATKTYNLDDLQRLRAMSNRGSTTNEAAPPPDEDDVTTGKMTDMDQQVKRMLAGQGEADEDHEDEDEDDLPTRMRQTPEPLASYGPAARGQSASLPDAGEPPEFPGVLLSPPPHIFDEDSNDEGPTIERSRDAFREERAVLARARGQTPAERAAIAGLFADDPLDDGPTKMRPPESLAPGSALFGPRAGAIGPPSSFPPHPASPHPSPAPPWRTPLPGVDPAAPVTFGDALQRPSAPPFPPGGAASERPYSAPPPPPVGSYPPGRDPHSGAFGLPSAEPPAATTGRQRLIAALIGVVLGLAVLLIYGALLESEPEPAARPPASATPAPPAALSADASVKAGPEAPGGSATEAP